MCIAQQTHTGTSHSIVNPPRPRYWLQAFQMVVWLALYATAPNQSYTQSQSPPVQSRYGSRLLDLQGAGSSSAGYPPNDEPWEYGGRSGPSLPYLPDTPVGPAHTPLPHNTTGTHPCSSPALPASPTHPMPAPTLPNSNPHVSPPTTPLSDPTIGPPPDTSCHDSPNYTNLPLHSTHPQTTNTAPTNAALHPPRATKTTHASLKIGSLNIRGGGSANTQPKWQHINQLLRDHRLGVLAVQETHLTPTIVSSLHSQFHSRLHILSSTDPDHPNSKGIAIVLNKQLTRWKDTTQTVLIPGRALLASIPWEGDYPLNVLAIYAPNNPSDSASFFNNLTSAWTQHHLPPVDILLGDFNMVEDSIDRLPAHGDSNTTTEALRDFRSLHQLSDGWWQSHPDTLAYSFIHSNHSGVQSRIDRIYATPDVTQHSRDWTLNQTAIQTDHKLITALIS